MKSGQRVCEIASSPRLKHARRRGITLTEILISIMIMGVGVLSILTLFPLGIMRMAQAVRASRSTLLTESALSDLSGRGLLYKPSFTTTWYAPPNRPYFDPFVLDPLNPNAAVTFPDISADGGAFHAFGTGLPVAYDPLWWYEVMVQSNGTATPLTTEARFGNGIGLVRNDPDGGPPSAHGLQRITNFKFDPSQPNGPLLWNVEPIFASTDDLVYQTEGNANPAQGYGDTTVPYLDPITGQPIVDLMFTWMFTGKQSDVGNARVFDGDIVVFHNRPFALDNGRPAGERVVEAIWGYGPPVVSGIYALTDSNVLLRWPSNEPDPDVRLGGWIADVTYERVQARALSRFGSALSYPAQRCHWYRVVRRGEVTINGNFKELQVTVDRSLRAKTPLAGGNPVVAARVEAALINPYVVNVTPRVFVTQ